MDMREARRRVQTLPVGLNPWSTVPAAVTSVDYAKRPEVLPAVREAGWDVLVVDEAHSVVAGRYGKAIEAATAAVPDQEDLHVVAQAIQSNGNPTQLLNGFGGGTDSNARLSALQSLLTFDTGLSLIQAASTTTLASWVCFSFFSS